MPSHHFTAPLLAVAFAGLSATMLLATDSPEDSGATFPSVGVTAEVTRSGEGREKEPARRVTQLVQRQSIHESTMRLMELRRSQAREQGEEFWEEYVVNGPEAIVQKPVSLHAEDELLPEVLGRLAELAGTRFEMAPGIDNRRVTIDVEDLPFAKALNAIGKASGTVTIHDRYAQSFILLNILDAVQMSVVEDFKLPIRHSDAEKFLELARKLEAVPIDGSLDVDADESSLLFTGSLDSAREFRFLVRDLNLRPPPEGERYNLDAIELEHQDPRGILLQLRRAFHGNFSSRGNRLAMAVLDGEVEAVRERVAEYDQPAEGE